MFSKKLFFLLLINFGITSLIYSVENAGILPYAYKNGKAYFLFGKEMRPRAGLVWTDFGGACDKPGESIQRCAAREFAEETRMVFKSPGENAIDYAENRIKQCFKIRGYNQCFAEIDYKDPSEILKSNQGTPWEKSDYYWAAVSDVKEIIKQPGLVKLRLQDNFYIYGTLKKTLNLSEVQKFIINVILAGETILPTEPITPQVPRELDQLSKDLNRLSSNLQQLMRQLQVLS